MVGSLEHGDQWHATEVIVETKPGNYTAFYNDVYDCIVHHTHPPVNPEDALNVIRIIEASKKSNQERRTVLLT